MAMIAPVVGSVTITLPRLARNRVTALSSFFDISFWIFRSIVRVTLIPFLRINEPDEA